MSRRLGVLGMLTTVCVLALAAPSSAASPSYIQAWTTGTSFTPTSLAIGPAPNRSLYGSGVTSAFLGSVSSQAYRFTSTSSILKLHGGTSSGSGPLLTAVATDPSGALYVVDSEGDQVLKVVENPSGPATVTPGWAKPDKPFTQAVGIARSPLNGRFYVIDSGAGRVVILNSDGSFYKAFGSPGSGDGQFAQEPGGPAIDAKGNVYIVDGFNFRVQKFDAEGNFLLKWGNAATPGLFPFRPDEAAVGPEGTVYVTTNDSKVKMFNDQGVLVDEWYGQGTAPGSGSAGAIATTTSATSTSPISKTNASSSSTTTRAAAPAPALANPRHGATRGRSAAASTSEPSTKRRRWERRRGTPRQRRRLPAGDDRRKRRVRHERCHPRRLQDPRLPAREPVGLRREPGWKPRRSAPRTVSRAWSCRR